MKIEGPFCFQNDSNLSSQFNTVLLKKKKVVGKPRSAPTSLENVASNKFNISNYFHLMLTLNTGMLKQ